MIDFTGIEKRRLSYEIAYRYVWYMHKVIYYRKVEIIGSEHLPQAPFLIVSNHQNGLLDAMLPVMLLTQFRMVFIARGDIFKKDAIAKGLKWFRILPAFRVRDTGKENLGENEKIFRLAANLLHEGHIVGLFPEAALQYKRAEGGFKKGFARIAFMASEKSNFQEKLQIVPVANYYTNFKNMGNDVLLNIGEAFTFEELYETYQQHPEAALRQLALKAQENVRPLMLDMQDKENFEQLDFLRDKHYRKMRAEKKVGKKVSDRLHCDQEFVAKCLQLKEEQPEHFSILMQNVREYQKLLNKHNFRDWLVESKGSAFCLVMKSLAAILSCPLFVICWLLTILPYKSGDFVRMKDERMSASLRMGISVVLAFPLWYLVLFGLSFALPWAWWWSFVFLPCEIIIVPLLAKTMNYLLRFYKKVYHSWRYKCGNSRKKIEIAEQKIFRLNF